MAWHLSNSVFHHVPKTGGHWVVAALRAAKIPVIGDDLLHSRTVLSTHKDFPSICFVRNPVDWYVSRWSCPIHRKRVANKEIKHIDAISNKELNSFNIWANRILHLPQFLTVGVFTKSTEDQIKLCTTVCKYENLLEETIKFFKFTKDLQTEEQEKIIRSFPKKNVSAVDQKPIVDEKIRRLILAKEKNIVEKYYPELKI